MFTTSSSLWLILRHLISPWAEYLIFRPTVRMMLNAVEGYALSHCEKEPFLIFCIHVLLPLFISDARCFTLVITLPSFRKLFKGRYIVGFRPTCRYTPSPHTRPIADSSQIFYERGNTHIRIFAAYSSHMRTFDWVSVDFSMVYPCSKLFYTLIAQCCRSTLTREKQNKNGKFPILVMSA